MLASRLRYTLLALAVVATTGACGRIHIRGERWKVVESTPKTDTRLQIGIEPTRTDDDAGTFGDREIREAAPYTAYIVVRGEHADAPLRVHEFRLHVGNDVTKLDISGEALEAAMKSGEDGQPAWARVDVPLGKLLVWRQDDEVALEVDVTTPWETAPTEVTVKLRAVLEESSGSKVEAFMSQ